MRNYDRINALPPAGIESKRAHIVGGGIAGLAAAAFLATDAHMPAASINIYEARPDVGGSMDAAGDPRAGYTSRGERELEAWMECLWYLCGKVPSLQTPGLTILDETHLANQREPIHSSYRLMRSRGELHDTAGPLMSRHDTKMLMKLIATSEDELGDMTVTDWFSEDFTKSTFWLCWSSMLAFREYHSLIEVKRYLARFMMYTSGLTHLAGILHTEYNEYDSLIKPIRCWLESLGVAFHTSHTVTDLQVETAPDRIAATSLTLRTPLGTQAKDLTDEDLVFFTNGSMTQNSVEGDTHTVARLNRDRTDRGVFTIWEQLAATDERFGHPEKFLSDIDATNWVSFFVTLRDGRRFFDHIEKKTGDVAGTGGAITITDSAWGISFALYGTYFPDQPDDTYVLWAYGQRSDVAGDHVTKPMLECSGAEMLAELLHHCGLGEGDAADIVANAHVSTSAMPYITSQFMPRKLGDRPDVVPEGSVNLAFIGQYAELPGDVVFTVETSVRTAMMAVWSLTDLQKPQIPMYEPAYDLRVLTSSLKASLGVAELDPMGLLQLLAVAPSPLDAVTTLRAIPEPIV